MRKLLWITCLFMLSGVSLSAQCWNNTDIQGTTLKFSSDYWAPGQTYNVTATSTEDDFAPGSPSQPIVIIPASAWSQGPWGIEDPNITLSNATYNSPTQFSFTVTISPNAPTAGEALFFECGLVLDGPNAFYVTPCADSIPTPVITSVSPAAFFAGETTTLTITGSGFLPYSSPCGNSLPNAYTATEQLVTDVVSMTPTQIVLTVEPAASDPAEPASVSVQNDLLNNPPPFLLATAATEVLPVPAIQLNGNTISGTNPTAQSAVVGNPINLTIDPTTLPSSGITISQNTWTVGGTNIGGYTPTTDSASVTPTTTTNQTLSTYWVYPSAKGSPFEVTYSYCFNDPIAGPQCSPNVTAKFSISGSGKMSNTAYNKLTIDTLTPCSGGDPTPYMVYGNITGSSCVANQGSTFGISFKPSGAPSGGTYSYVQLINSDSRTENTISCTSSQGIDTAYPYGGIIPNTNPPQAEDAPGVPLPSDYVVTRSFNATMYLMWTSNVANSIPVPIGYQTWGFTGTAQKNSSGNWSATANGTPGPVGSFVSSNGNQSNDGYPTWSTVSTENCNN